MTDWRPTFTRCRRLLFGLAWNCPFFALPAARIRIRIDDTIPTACVTDIGIVYVNPAFAASLTDPELVFVLAHELMHLLLLHTARRGVREQQRWNFACDRALNIALVAARLTRPKCALLPQDPAHNNYSAEEHYEVEPELPSDSDGGAGAQPTAGCGVAPDRGLADGSVPGEGDRPLDGDTFPSPSQAARQWREIAVIAVSQARQAGMEGAGILARVLVAPPSRVKWSQVIRGAVARALAERGRDDVAFSRRNRRSFDSDIILPGGVAYHATAAVIVDTSGSVPSASLARAVAEVVAISAASKVKIYLVIHDTRVRWQGWLRTNVRPSEVSSRLTGRGGTQFAPAYAAVEGGAKKFDAVVHLTDGEPCDPWPPRPKNARHLVVALLGCASRRQLPDDATVVEVEL